MGSITRFAKTAGVPVEHVAGLQLVRTEDAGELLLALAAAGTRVLGAEGFRVEEGDTVRPATDAILDLSGVDDASESIREARRFIDAVSAPDLLVEFVIEGDDGP